MSEPSAAAQSDAQGGSRGTDPDVAPRSRSLVWLLAAVPGLLVVLTIWFVAVFAGRPEAFASVGLYRAALNTAVLLRLFGMFLAVVLVWWELRTRRASRAALVTAVISGPLTYAVLEAFRMLSFFPAPEAAYYMVNPLAVAALASQAATAGAVELLWRLVGSRQGRWSGPVITLRLLLVIGGGLAVLYFAVLDGGGTTGFYLFNAGYRLLFT